MRLPSFIVALVLVALILSSCEKKYQNVTRVKVTGKVTLDKKPLLTGSITFDPQNGEPPGVFNILDGEYEGMAPVGKNKVILTATKKVNLKEKYKMDGPGYDQIVDENMLPARYSDGSITREVTAEGPNNFDFDTKSQ